jgi:hypothetical protein
MFKNNWRQSGFSLVQGMILASVIAGSALVASKMLSEQKLVQKTAENKDQIEELHKVIFATLQNRSNCEATVVTANIQNTLLTSPPNNGPVVPAIRNGGSTPAFVRFDPADPTTHVTYMNGSIAIERIQFFYNPTPPAGDSPGLGRLEITYSRFQSNDPQKRTKEGYGGKQIKKSIKLRIQRNPNVT